MLNSKYRRRGLSGQPAVPVDVVTPDWGTSGWAAECTWEVTTNTAITKLNEGDYGKSPIIFIIIMCLGMVLISLSH